MPTLTDWQVSFDSLVMGSGTSYHVDPDGIEGLDMPSLRASDVDRFLSHGELAGRDLIGGRTFSLVVTVVADDSATMASRIDALGAATVPGGPEREFSYSLPGQGQRTVFARPRRRGVAEDQMARLYRAARVALEFHATDPRIYSATENLTTIPAPVASGGAHWPLDWAPLDWGVNGTTGIVILNNAGSFATPFRAQLVSGTNSYVGPFVENVTTGQILRFSNFTIPAGEWVDFDSLNRTVLANGTASRSNYLTPDSDWFNLEPGDNEIRLGAFTSQPGAGLHVRWRSAWI